MRVHYVGWRYIVAPQSPMRGFSSIKSLEQKMNLNLIINSLNKGKHMPNENQTQEEFLKDLEPDESLDAFGQPVEKAVATTVEEPEKEITTEEKYNRRERRLSAKLQAERESSIALAARLEALTETQKFGNDTPRGFDETIERIYGNNTPEAAEATRLLQKALKDVETSATKNALELFKEEQRKEREAIRKEEGELTNMLEELEDEYNVDLTSTSAEATRKTFYTLLERLSPKDSAGNILNYADHHAVWEELQSRKAVQAPNRAKDLANRSMVRTGASPSSTVADSAAERFLKENGII